MKGSETDKFIKQKNDNEISNIFPIAPCKVSSFPNWS